MHSETHTGGYSHSKIFEFRDPFYKLIIITRQVLGRPVCDRGAIPRTLVQSNVVRSRLIILINEEINEANWMVSNSAKLDCRPSSTLNLESLRLTVPEIWPGQNRGRKKEKKNSKANWMVSNSAKLDCRTKQQTQFGVSASNGSRDMARTKSWRKKKDKKNNEANWMVSNSAQLDCRTKQHTLFGVSASNGSRYMGWTKSWRKKKEKKRKKRKKMNVDNPI